MYIAISDVEQEVVPKAHDLSVDGSSPSITLFLLIFFIFKKFSTKRPQTIVNLLLNLFFKKSYLFNMVYLTFSFFTSHF